MASCSIDKTVKIWSMLTTECLAGWEVDVSISCVKWLDNPWRGYKVLASFSETKVNIWDKNGACISTHLLSESFGFVSPSGNNFTSGSKIINTITNQVIKNISGIGSMQVNMSWNGQEKLLLVSSATMMQLVDLTIKPSASFRSSGESNTTITTNAPGK